MKIVMITHDTKIDRRIILEAKSLLALGHEVRIIAFPWDGEEDRDAGVEIIRLPYADVKANVDQVARSAYKQLVREAFPQPLLKFLVAIYSLFFRSDYEKHFEQYLLDLAMKYPADVYHVHDLPSLSTGVKLARKYNAKLIYDSHELFVEQGLSWVDKMKWTRIEKKYIHAVDHIITVNESIAKEIARRYQVEMPSVIRNKTEYPTIGKRDEIRNKIRAKFDIPLDKPMLLYQGGMVDSRNLTRLIDIISKCESSWGLVLLGGGDYQKELKAYAGGRENIYFINEVSQKQLLEHTIGLADMGIIPYKGDCLNNYFCTPNKLFEFIAAGIPIITNNLPEVAKVVAGYDIGKVIDINEVSAVSQILDDLACDDKQLDQYRRNIFAIQNEFSWNYEEKILLAIYQGIN